MIAARKRKLALFGLFALILTVVLSLILYALGQNINLFYTPTDVVGGKAKIAKNIRLGGMVEKGSLVRRSDRLAVQFKITDFKEAVIVSYQGILPDLFREGQGIVAEGQLVDNRHFQAREVLAKHDANYMPPEVKASLKQQAKVGSDDS